MGDAPYTLHQYVADLRAIAAEATEPGRVIARVRPLARRLAAQRDWVRPHHYAIDPEAGMRMHLLHEEADHTLAVFVVAWGPGQSVLPHDHGTWAVVAGVDGPEVNTFWKRVDDGSREGYAEVVPAGEHAIAAGEVVSMLPGAIHSVRNDSAQVTLSLHTYGINTGHTHRFQYDVAARTVWPHPRSAFTPGA